MNTSKPARWFRMYAEFATDPKVQMLSEIDQRRYLMILCLRCSNGSVTLQDSEVTFQLRISNEEWCRTKAELEQKGLLDSANQPTAWDKRQYASDSSAERVARHRAKHKQTCNVTVTPPETETETEKTLKPLRGFDEFWSAYPKKKAKGDAERAWRRLNPNAALVAKIMEGLERAKASPDWQKDNGQYIKYPQGWINSRGWEDEDLSQGNSIVDESLLATIKQMQGEQHGIF